MKWQLRLIASLWIIIAMSGATQGMYAAEAAKSDVAASNRLPLTPFMDAQPLSALDDETLMALIDSARSSGHARAKTDSFWLVRKQGAPVDVVQLEDPADPSAILMLYYLPETAQHFFLRLAKSGSEPGKAEIRLWSATEAREILMTEAGITVLDEPTPSTFRFNMPQSSRRVTADSLSILDIIGCFTKTLGWDITTVSWSQLIGSLGCSSSSLFATYETVTNCLSVFGIGVNNASATAGCFGGVAYLATCGYMNCSNAGHGTIQVAATVNGGNWYGSVNCSLSGAATGNVTSVPVMFSNQPVGQFTLQCSGGPGTLQSITPSSRQTLSANSTISFSLNYTQPAAASPTFSPVPGTYVGSVTVAMYSQTTGATIRYTLNGSDPTVNSTVYTGPITISSTSTLRAKAFKTGMAESTVGWGTYTILPPLTVACSATPNPVRLNQTITWQAQPQGGSGSFWYSWLNGITSQSYSKSYSAIGTISNWVVITDRQTNQSRTAYCSLGVTR